MAVRRGTHYRVPTFARALGLLVLTNDEWNEAPTLEVSGAIVYAEAGPGRMPIPGLPLHAGPLLRLPKEELAEAVVELSPDQLVVVEEAVSEILGLDAVLGDPPRAPVPRPGAIDYPRWSNIYYAGEPVGTPPERKRYLVVSHDPYNHALAGGICIRTTTSERRGGPTIPTLRDGTTRAVCVLPTFYATRSVAIRATRPAPPQLFMSDMITVAAGLREALALPERRPKG